MSLVMIILVFFGVVFVMCFIEKDYWKKIVLKYKQFQYGDMNKAFPDHPNWEEGDNILYMKNYRNDSVGELIAMREKAILISGYNGKLKEVYPHQIKCNQTHENRDKEKKYRDYHNDILPVLRDKNDKFPTANNQKLLT